MQKSNFNLNDYTQHILLISKANKVSVEQAMQYFLANLATMKEHYKGASELNYHELGQRWNKLLNKEKVAQKAELKARLARYNKGGNTQ